ncbi:chemotaxis protein CheW [Estrella lausannensis]|uniref:Chemotaxis signal transduction protein n=1 Tax=Estrella lausannensis TaxID=483423 RepID=A0A0H5DSK6_9BACT|nr:chemotaxis protein CheW [Estrella lausannensis]CRX39293.1 Chemotaxis signal transduction protein [Estrella lausannensis]
MDILVFVIDSQQFALELAAVRKVISMVKVTHQPHPKNHMMGIINFHGEVVPVFNCRSLLGLRQKEIELTDQLIICVIADQLSAFWVDRVEEIAQIPNQELSSLQESKSKEDAWRWIVNDLHQVTLLFNLSKLLESDAHRLPAREQLMDARIAKR